MQNIIAKIYYTLGLSLLETDKQLNRKHDTRKKQTLLLHNIYG